MAVIISLASIAVLTAIDQIIKYFVELNLAPVGTKGFIDAFLEWEYVRNTGAAFGSFSNSTTLLSVVTGIIIIGWTGALVLKKIKNKYLVVVSVMIIAGGLGNLIDRILKGYVVDYIKVLFVDFAVFNFADILVTCGAFMLIGYLVWDIIMDSKKKKQNSKE